MADTRPSLMTGGVGSAFELGRVIEKSIVDANRAEMRTRLAQLLAMETVELAKISNAIRDELERRKEYAVRFGIEADRRL